VTLTIPSSTTAGPNVFVTHISTACVLLEIGSVRILTDPVFDEGRKQYSFGPGFGTTRYIGPAMKAQDVLPLDTILLSHVHHSDNLDQGGKALLPSAREIITNRSGKKKLQVPVTGLADWEKTTITGTAGDTITVTAIPASHGPRWLPGTQGVCGFVLEWVSQKNGALYISGDTIRFRELLELPNHFGIGTALLHLGAVHFWLPSCIRFTFNSSDAVEMTKLLKLKQVVPIHYERDVWRHFREDKASYDDAFAKAGLSASLRWLKKGVRVPIDV
jgi:L-ascorbate metabolism protein UlaG (beta-lactamase superfamily)